MGENKVSYSVLTKTPRRHNTKVKSALRSLFLKNLKTSPQFPFAIHHPRAILFPSGAVEGELANPARAGRQQRQSVFPCCGSLAPSAFCGNYGAFVIVLGFP